MMGEGNSPVWVLAEHHAGNLLPVSLEITGQARQLADALDAPLEAILLGENIDPLVNQLIHAGADVVHLGDARQYSIYQYEIYSQSIVTLAEERNPQILLVGSTYMGRELAPVIAAKLGTGLTAHCTNLIIDQDGVLEQQIPAYGGLMTILCPEKRPQIATVARGVFPMPEMEVDRQGVVLSIEPPRGLTTRLTTLDIVHSKPEGVPLETAQIVVAGGAGAGSLEGWLEIQDLANILQAGFGSTRPAVDEGWTELETMIGQSGRMVNPELYIGIGLSGEQQHMVGISGAKLMIAINNDPKAPIFEQVDLGIVEDCRVFIPALIAKLKQLEMQSGRSAHVV
jgi:electron transfer flavoprotein alpha subunit